MAWLRKITFAETQVILHDIELDDTTLLSVMPLLEQLHELIRACKFTEFWTAFNSESEGATGMSPSCASLSATADEQLFAALLSLKTLI